MGIFDDIKDEETSGDGKYLKGEDFVDGITLLMLDKPKVIECNQPRFGREIGGKPNMTIRYTFRRPEKPDIEVFFDSHSRPFKRALQDAEVKVGDKISITRYGKGFDTSYEAKVHDNKQEEEVDLDDLAEEMDKGSVDIT